MTGSFHETVEFRMREVFDDPDRVRLVLSGELDLAVAGMFGDRLRQLWKAGCDVRLDLADLNFIDSSGLRELVSALVESRSDGWRLEIDPQVSAAVRRTVDLAGLHSHFWPDRG
jgi:anti-anti-sigma factor